MKTIVLMPPNWLGDVVMAQPAMRAITAHYKEDNVFVVGRSWLVDLLPFLNLEHENIQYLQNLPSGADAVFIFPNSLRSALQAFRSRAVRRIGFRREGRGILLTHAYTSRVNLLRQHHLGYYQDLLQQYGVPTPFAGVELKATEAEQKQAIALLQEKGIKSNHFVCVAPGAQFGGAKRYPAPAYAAVLAHLSKQGWDIVILGTPAEREISNMCIADVQGKYWNAAGETSLQQALQLVSLSSLMLCNDSGLMHVAAGMNIATVAMFGATDPERTSPSGRRIQVLYQPASCSPCLQRECHTAGHPCMVNISPELVLEACQRALLM